MKRWYRSVSDKKLTGLCGGLAQYLNLDPTLLRVLVVILTFASSGSLILFYFLAALMVPKEPYSGSFPHS
ncbi:PspC domain-containing protein [Paenibacillus mucilaginosus]|uniref:Phage shock protein PspC n=3 Tax=Paenibacillus mucilaginosus TaxID=61624 RepID=H6NBK7_9BACL|nr:PspC domain-containing protein [Paenibacillus mucilaginosus]AEI46156.1 phage shock protein C, PspC [Paenibacillus mucilaginosus KNP414]AFC33776.1 phage shock protein PspC [Paenibacillus mucilaginosus 3016]AFH66107.1 phage-shock protein [Paenibacillus mucilaginosus K02]MCG7213710.1 PspC domain-containing protein [Paenibacillus mucilaginosus]WDM27486.1 PspC domain-containing protein [Paenibacillus mucilaginosus]